MANILNGYTILGKVIGLKKNYTALKISNIALDGTPYVQQTGTAIDRRIADIFCPTLEDKDSLDDASNNGALLTVDNWGGYIIKGYIEKDIKWKEWRDGHGVGRFNFIVKEIDEA